MATRSARPLIAGPRVALRFPARADGPALVALRRRSRAFLEPWEATPQEGPDPFSDAWFDRLLATADTETSRRLLVVLDDGDDAGTPVGQVSAGGIVRGAFQSAYIGYWIGEPYARRGYMTEALTLLLRLAFERWRLHRVEANIIPGNTPSVRLVRRLGFRHEGLALRYLNIAGRWQDHEHWALTIEDWRAKPGIAKSP